MTRNLVQPDVLTLNTEEVMSGLNPCYSNMQEPTYVRGIAQNQKKTFIPFRWQQAGEIGKRLGSQIFPRLNPLAAAALEPLLAFGACVDGTILCDQASCD